MTLVSLTLPNDGETIDASDVNGPFNAIASVLNGNIDDQNVNTISGTKITTGTLPLNAFTTAAQLDLAKGWNDLGAAPTSVVHNGNGSYTGTFAVDQSPKLNPGTRIRTTRAVPAPTQSTSLNGTNQYWNDTTISGMTFTDDFVISAWVKLSSYGQYGIVSRYNGTNGFILQTSPSGVVTLSAYNAGSGNESRVTSYQSIPLNKWTHITAQLDMSAFTATPTTSYIMFNGVDVPSLVARAGTNPTALIQAGNLEIGSYNGGVANFPGKIAQAAIFNSKVTQATMRGYMNQSYIGNEANLISAYPFNGNGNDLNTTNGNNLTAQNSATATNADAPWGGQADGTVSGTLDYGIVVGTTPTTVTWQTPEGATSPTTGGISAISYSGVKAPYGFPTNESKWILSLSVNVLLSQATSNDVWWSFTGSDFNIPVGSWSIIGQGTVIGTSSVGADFALLVTIDNTPRSGVSAALTGIPKARTFLNKSSTFVALPFSIVRSFTAVTSSTYYVLARISSAAGVAGLQLDGGNATFEFMAKNAYL